MLRVSEIEKIGEVSGRWFIDQDEPDHGYGPQPGYQPGRGLLGIGERAAVFGGTVEHGRGDGGGFRVRAVLPLP